MAESKSVILKIKRQPTPNAPSHWEEFSVPYRPNMNVISALMDIAADPVTRDGKPTTPITYDSNCLEEVCGSCAMLINGKARMACSALIDQLEQPIRLEPFSKFPVVRDLATDRGVIFENLKAVKAWVPNDGRGPRIRLSLVALHFLLLLYGSLSPIQRGNRVRRSSHHFSGAAV